MLLDGFSRGPSARTLAPAPVKPAGTRVWPVRSRRVARLAQCPQYAPVSAAAWASEQHLDKPVRCGIKPVITGTVSHRAGWEGRRPFLAERAGSLLMQHSARVRARGAVLPDGASADDGGELLLDLRRRRIGQRGAVGEQDSGHG